MADEHSVEAAVDALMGQSETVNEWDEKDFSPPAQNAQVREDKPDEEPSEYNADGELYDEAMDRLVGDGDQSGDDEAQDAAAEDKPEADPDAPDAPEPTPEYHEAVAQVLEAEGLTEDVRNGLAALNPKLPGVIAEGAARLRQYEQRESAMTEAGNSAYMGVDHAAQRFAGVLAEQHMQDIAALRQQIESPEFAALRAEDPAEALLVQERINTELQDRQKRIGELDENLAQYQTQLTQQNFQYQNAVAEQSIPGWSDPAIQQRALQVAQAAGFSNEEIFQRFDHRLIRLMLHVADYAGLKHATRQGEEAAAKIKRTVPKAVTPGAGRRPTTAASRNKRELAAAHKKLAQSNKVEDAAVVFENMRFTEGMK